MTDPVYAIETEFPTSCPTEDAVDALVGDEFEEDAQGNATDLSMYEIDSLIDPVISWDRTIEPLREKISQRLSKAAAAGRPTKTYQRKLNALVKYEEKMRKHHLYLIDIEDELAKGESSALRVDQRATEKTGRVHITLRSLDLWARNQYDISILDRSALNPVTEKSPDRQEHQQENESAPKGGMGRISMESLYTTFAFLIEAFCKTASKYRHADGRPNAAVITEHLAQLAIEAKGPDSPLGQGVVSIGDRIEAALRIKRKKYPGHK
jgi:hypothetical protein